MLQLIDIAANRLRGGIYFHNQSQQANNHHRDKNNQPDNYCQLDAADKQKDN